MSEIIDLIKYIIIAIIQGISEIFPISSSGHLAIIYSLFNINEADKLNLTLFLHLASSIALCVFYKKEIKNILKGFILYILKNKKEYKTSFKFTLYIILATIPSIIVGIFIKPLIEKVFNDLSIIAIGFLLTSLLLLYENKRKTNSNYTFLNIFSVGVFQSLALFPGLSRSGTTMFAAKLAKLDDIQGKRLSFFLLIPISLGSTILSIFDYNFNNLNNITLYGVGFIVTFIMTFISLKQFINKYNSTHNIYFSYYLIILSYIILLTTI